MKDLSTPTPNGTAGQEANVADLPIIDISTLNYKTGKQVLDAFTTYGFLYITPDSTPFSPSLVSSTFAVSKSLFALPNSTKQDFWIDTSNRGYTGIGNEILDPENQKTGDRKEAWNWGEVDELGKLQQRVPGNVEVASEHGLEGAELAEEKLKRFEHACRECCGRLLELLALGLEVKDEEDAGKSGEDRSGKGWFARRHGRPSGSTVRMLRYPPTTGDGATGEEIGAGAHSDYGSVTLLFQQPGGRGLELRGEDGLWRGVEVVPKGYDLERGGGLPPIVVNVGDLLEYWTSGLLKSTVHRVVMPEGAKEDRYSLVYFCHPRNDEGLIAVPSKIVEERGKLNSAVGYGGGSQGTALTAKEHLMRRLDATYGSRKT